MSLTKGRRKTGQESGDTRRQNIVLPSRYQRAPLATRPSVHDLAIVVEAKYVNARPVPAGVAGPLLVAVKNNQVALSHGPLE